MLVDQHGADALIEAALKADGLLDAGDIDGRATCVNGGAKLVHLGGVKLVHSM